MYKDPSEFRERFKAYKEGKSVREIYGLPEYHNGNVPELSPDELFVELMGPLLYRELLYQGVQNPDAAYKNMIVQLAYESDRGRSRVARELHNYGGVGWNGKEYLRYKNDADFVHDYVKLMNRRYKSAISADTLYDYAKAIKKLGYYEDTLENYSRNLIGMKSLHKAAIAHRNANPELYKIDRVPVQSDKPIVATSDATRVTPIPTIQQKSTPSTWIQQSPYLAQDELKLNFRIATEPIYDKDMLIKMIDDSFTPTYGAFQVAGMKDGKLPGYDDGKEGTISQGHKLIPIDVARTATEPDYTKDGWFWGTLKRGVNNFIKTVEYFTDSARRVLNGRGSTEDKINVALDLGGAAGAKAITKVIRNARSIKPLKTSVSLKGKTPKEVANYFDLHPELVSDADPEKVAHAAEFIKQDALPRAQLAARKHGRNVDFDPNTVTFKEADFMDSKLGGVSTPNKIVYMRKGAPVDHYTHEMSHEMRRVVGGTPEEASRLLSTYKNSERFLKEHSNFPQLDEDYAVNTQLRDMISYANGGVKDKELDAIIDNMSDDMFERYAILANAYTHDMATTGGLNKNNYKKTLKYVGATYPMLYAAFSRDRYNDGKLPGYKNGKIKIKPSKRGTFTAAAKKHGASVAEFERRVLKNPEKYSKAMVKKARFSHNARSWKH